MNRRGWKRIFTSLRQTCAYACAAIYKGNIGLQKNNEKEIGNDYKRVCIYMSNGQYSRIKHEEKECREM